MDRKKKWPKIRVKIFQTRGFYEDYIKSLDFIEHKHGYRIDFNKYEEIIGNIHKRIMNKIIFDAREYVCPLVRMKISVTRNKQQIFKNEDLSKDGKKWRGIVNWGATNKLWKSDPEAKTSKTLIFFTASDTGGYIYRFQSRHIGQRDFNVRHYIFRPTIIAKGILKDYIKSGIKPGIDYSESIYGIRVRRYVAARKTGLLPSKKKLNNKKTCSQENIQA